MSKSNYRAEIDLITGKPIYRYFDNTTNQEVFNLSKHQKKRAKSKIFNPIEKEIPLTARAKAKGGIAQEWFHFFDSHNDCVNPANKLMNYRMGCC